MDTKNWMSHIADDTPISAISIPATHDSATRYSDARIIACCQSLFISEQLDIGCRVFDIRLDMDGGRFRCVHGISSCRKSGGLFAPALTFDDIYASFSRFLAENPGETVSAVIMADRGERSEIFYREFYKKYVENNPLWYTENRVPSLGECRGRIVLINRCREDTGAFDDGAFGINFSHWPYQGKAELPSVMSFDVPLLSGGGAAASVVVQDKYTLRNAAKWKEAALPMFTSTQPDGKIYINCLSTAGELNPRRSAHRINPEAVNYLTKNRSFCGWVLMDFANRQLCEAVIHCNRGGEL
ncbi:MAG: hypothetical protein GX851_02735 [Clostridiales bacterium]|nr:hypothetical protein [Clostridiales bacterium]